MKKISISDIKKDMIFANYKLLCEYVGEKATGGDSKKAQLKRWRQYFNWQKKGNSFIITEVYEKPLLSSDKRKIFMSLAEQLLLNFISDKIQDNNETTVSMTFENWFKVIGVLSPEIYYKNAYTDLIKSDSRLYNCSDFVYDYVCFRIKNKVKSILLSTVNSLAKNDVIDGELFLYIKEKNQSERRADLSEIKLFDDLKTKVLNEMGIKKLYEININHSKKQKFWKRVEVLYKTLYGWDKVYYKFNVCAKNKDIIRKYNKIQTADLQSHLCQEIRKHLESEIENKKLNGEHLGSLFMNELMEYGEIIYDGFTINDSDAEQMIVLLDLLL